MELPGQVTGTENAVTLASIERVLPGPGAKHHLRVIQKMGIDGDLATLDGKGLHNKPVGVDVVWWLASCPITQKHDVSDDASAFACESVGRKANRPQEVCPLGHVLAEACIQLVQGEVACDQGKHAAGLQGVGGLGDEIAME